METVCLKCGDVGFSEAIAFCNKCQAYGLHRYCLDGPVILYDDDVTWYCEDCEPKPILPCSLNQSTLPLSKTTDPINLANNANQAKSKIKPKNCRKRLKKRKRRKQKKIEEKQKKVKNSGTVAKTEVLVSDNRKSPELEHPQRSISCEQESEPKNECGSVPRDVPNSNGRPECVRISQVTATDDLNCVALDCDVVAQPIADPIWRGSLHFRDETITVNQLLGHLSCLASTKVLEETALFPEVLRADLLPRSLAWPKRFKEEGPTDKSIALYFLPENESSEKVFDRLVEYIIRIEVAARVVAKNAELLIFPSTVLPIQHRRFQAKYYLWGIFLRRKQISK